jgi:hypothetical protein
MTTGIDPTRVRPTPTRPRMGLPVLISRLALVLTLLTGCGGRTATGGTVPSTGATSAEGHQTPVLPPSCPNPAGGLCLGRLTAGGYHTQAFRPGLRYVVPGGWQNMEDLDANVELLPPRSALSGVDAGTADYIGVYRDVTLEDGCDTGPVPGLADTPAGMMQHLRRRPDLVVARVRTVRIGGLTGQVADLRQRPTWRRTCPYSDGRPLSSVLVGIADHGLDHPIVPKQTMRLYLLAFHGTVIAVEVEDVRSAGHLAAYSRVVSTFRFLTGPRVR